MSAPNAIVELDSHLEAYPDSHRSAPDISAPDIGAVADYCQYVGLDQTASELEILRRELLEKTEWVPRYTVGVLTEIAVDLAVAKTHTVYDDDFSTDELLQIRSIIREIGEWIIESHEAPIDSSVRDLAIENIRIEDGYGEYIDPISALLGHQNLQLVDETGAELDIPPM